MTVPTVLLELLIALLEGALYHAVRGGNGWRFLLCLGLGAFGFALGQLTALLGLSIFRFGGFDLGLGLLGGLLVLVLGDWLVRVEPGNKSGV
ncbi:MAG TPA: hypothetical protein PKI78_08165 [Anaerolineales bacterium]|nr:hypothetical protein [Anaerolineales bacterium]